MKCKCIKTYINFDDWSYFKCGNTYEYEIVSEMYRIKKLRFNDASIALAVSANSAATKNFEKNLFNLYFEEIIEEEIEWIDITDEYEISWYTKVNQ